MSSQQSGIEAVGGSPPVADSASSDARLGSRDECPVLPCLPHTALNADRIDPDGSPAPAAGDDENSPRLTAALIVISVAQLMVVLDATIVTVALPSIQRALHFSPANLEWVISGYTLAFGGLLLLGGRLGDVLGRRRMFVLGLAVFSLGSLAGGLATTSGWLIASRAVQGVGGAIAAPTRPVPHRRHLPGGAVTHSGHGGVCSDVRGRRRARVTTRRDPHRHRFLAMGALRQRPDRGRPSRLQRRSSSEDQHSAAANSTSQAPSPRPRGRRHSSTASSGRPSRDGRTR